jgi:hypothetical protein
VEGVIGLVQGPCGTSSDHIPCAEASSLIVANSATAEPSLLLLRVYRAISGNPRRQCFIRG